MTRTRISACIFVVASSLAACTGTGDVEYAGEVHVASPELIAVSPGVQVIADADEPIFYASNDYWLYRDGYWFRSNDYRRGYARVEFSYVPQQLRAIEIPQSYVHYRSHMGRDRADQASPPGKNNADDRTKKSDQKKDKKDKRDK